MEPEFQEIIIKTLVQKGFTEQDSALLAATMINTVESMSFEQKIINVGGNYESRNIPGLKRI